MVRPAPDLPLTRSGPTTATDWKKNSQRAGPCADAVGFTRLCATPNGEPDGLQEEIPSLFTVELSHAVLSRHFGFGVLNRPNSVRQLLERLPTLPRDRPEDLGSAEYLLLLETDHVIMKPIPNPHPHPNLNPKTNT